MTERDPYTGARKPGIGPSVGGAGDSSTFDRTRQGAGDLADRAQVTAGEAAEQAKRQATSRLTEQKSRAADSLGSVADAVRRTGDQLRGQDNGAIADYAQTAAERIERFSTYLRDTEVNEMVYEVERFARRQPAIFVGGAILLGFMGARFLKSSGMGRQAESGYYPRRRGQPGYLSNRYPSGFGQGTGYRGTPGMGAQGGPRPTQPIGGTGLPGGTTQPTTPGTSSGGVTPGQTDTTSRPPLSDRDEKRNPSGGSGVGNAAA